MGSTSNAGAVFTIAAGDGGDGLVAFFACANAEAVLPTSNAPLRNSLRCRIQISNLGFTCTTRVILRREQGPRPDVVDARQSDRSDAERLIARLLAIRMQIEPTSIAAMEP